jgi:hypothetical protein
VHKPNSTEPQEPDEGCAQPMTPTAWRDASWAERMANAMTVVEFAAAPNRWSKGYAAIVDGAVRLHRTEKIEVGAAVFLIEAATAAVSGRCTLSAARIATMLGCATRSVDRARAWLAENGYLQSEGHTSKRASSPLVSRYKDLADADLHDLFNDWAPPAKVGRTASDAHDVGSAGQPPTQLPTLSEKTSDTESSTLDLNPGFARDRSLQEKKEDSSGEGTALVVSSTVDQEATPGELMPVEREGTMAALFEDGALLARSVRDALETDDAARAEFRRHLAGGVPPGELIGAANRAWVSSADKTNPVAYWLKVVDTEVARLQAKVVHRGVVEGPGAKRHARGNGIVVELVGYGGTTKTVVKEADLRRLMHECPSLTQDAAYHELQKTAEPYRKKVKLPSALGLVDETIGRLRGQSVAPDAGSLTFNESLKAVEAEMEKEERSEELRRHVAGGGGL